MKNNLFLKILVSLAILAVILQIGKAATDYFIVETAVAAGELIPLAVTKTALLCGLFIGFVYGISTSLLAIWVIGARIDRSEAVYCKGCKHWDRTANVCRHPDGMCASGVAAQNNGCNLWERRE